MHICIVSPSYPEANATNYAFVEQLVKEFVRQGNRCTVITPHNTYWKSSPLPSEYERKDVDDKTYVEVYRPRFSNRNIPLLPVSTTYHSAQIAFERLIKERGLVFDCIYCHFFICANIAWHYAHENRIPFFVVTGESVIPTYIQKASPFFSWKKFRHDTNGVICVSSKNLEECVKLNYAERRKCKVFPNAIDETLFKKMDKSDCRSKLCIPNDVFVIAFVGWYSERKGVMRVSNAIDAIEEDNIYSLFIGKKQSPKDTEPKCKNIIFKGGVSHDDIPIYLNAADAFVLPTQHEGCCNAVIEAMACGLPVISSNRPFNWDVLNESNSILINPDNIEDIKNAIVQLRDDEQLRIRLSQGAIDTAKRLTLTSRAKHILDFIKDNM